MLCGGLAPAFGGAREDAQDAGLSGALVVCKEYGTVLGTFLTDVRGRNITRLNFLFGEDVGPRFSPDGERILFASTRGGTMGLWTMNRKGEEAKRICDGDQGDWFPDGQRVAFRRQGQIVARSLDDGKETVLSPVDWKSCSWPACSPDGTQILFLVAGAENDSIFLTTPGAAEPKRLAEGETLGAPRWAPAGDRIAYQSGAHIWVMDPDGSHPRQLTTSGGIQRRPAWSPEGTAIAYCQGPSPQGPWQLAVTRADGTHTFMVPRGDVRSVLCPGWGLAEPGRKPATGSPNGTAAPPPRIRLWEIDQPLTAAPANWDVFCRERRGWDAVPAGDAQPRRFRGGCAVEGDKAVLLLLAGKTNAVFIPTPAARQAIEFVPLDLKFRETGPLESLRVLRHEPDEAVLESSSRSEGALVRVSWALGGSRPVVRPTPVENAGALRVTVPMQCVVVPDRLGDDIVADPVTLGAPNTFLPWAPVVAGLVGNGSDQLVLVCPEPGQRLGLRKGNGPLLAGADVAFQNRPIWVGAVGGDRAWHIERVGAERQADPLRFKWRMPFPAAWRLTVEGDGKRYSTLFSDKESAFFDKKEVLFRKSKEFEAPVRSGVIYLYDRTASTPLDVLTPLDLLRDALGLKGAERALDEEGVTGYRVAAKPTMWADLTVTLQSLRFLFEQHVEVQDSAYAGHLLDDILPFVEGMDQRLEEYGGFMRGVRWGKVSPAVQEFRERPSPVSAQLATLAEKQRALKSAKEVLPIVAKIRQLTTQDSSENRKQFEECCKELLAAVGPREEMLKSYRRIAIEMRDAAGVAPLRRSDADLLELAEQERAASQAVLRNRFYIEGDWRGEEYKVPAFWLGPRPYE